MREKKIPMIEEHRRSQPLGSNFDKHPSSSIVIEEHESLAEREQPIDVLKTNCSLDEDFSQSNISLTVADSQPKALVSIDQ